MASVTSLYARREAHERLRAKLMARKEARAVTRDLSAATERALSGSFPKQREVVLSEAKRIVTHSGRRAGKTDAWALRLYIEGMKPENAHRLSGYATSSMLRSEELVGSALQELSRDLRLGIRRVANDGAIHYILPNEHRIWVTGCKDLSEVGKFRGYKFTGFVLDECQCITRFLNSLVVDSIEPALMDYDGWLGLSGTPNVQEHGDWYEFCCKSNYVKYHWDCRDNPYIKNPLAYFQKLFDSYNWTWDTPRFKREYLGLWCSDKSSLCYPFSRDTNWVQELPILPNGRIWNFGMGIDLGVVDPCAWTIGAHHSDHPIIYLVHSELHHDMSPTLAAQKTIELQRAFGVTDTWVDRGGPGAAFVADWKRRYNLDVIPARKVDVAGQIALMAGELQAQAIQIAGEDCRDLEREWAILPWNEDKTGHEKGYQDHLSDSARYLVRGISPGDFVEDPGIIPGHRDQEFADFLERKRRLAEELDG